MKNRENIKVCVRMRPLLLPYQDQQFWAVDHQSNSIFSLTAQNSGHLNTSLFAPRYRDEKLRYSQKTAPQYFSFDSVYGPEFTSQQIYTQSVRPVINRVLGGYNGTVFMYGQTTSGKTFTMLGTPQLPGVLPCSVRDIFQFISRDANRQYSV